jgi:hypothetical protein
MSTQFDLNLNEGSVLEANIMATRMCMGGMMGGGRCS